MSLGRRIAVGGLLGFFVAVLLELLYDTSANVSVVEGAHHHLRFGAAVLVATGAAIFGAVVGGLSALDH